MKRLKKILLVFVFTIAFIIIGRTLSNASYQKMNSLDYQAYINDDGSMYVVEDWNIKVSETNTLFKNFKKDNNKFSKITNVKITDLSQGKQFTQIYSEMYHVTKDCYYALDVSGNKFEIAWGVGLDDSSATKEYRIEYIVEDAVGKYNDCAELYWQFIGSDFEIDAKDVTGTIHLPTLAKSKNEIKVWGHTKELNGEIYATDLDKVEFNVKNFNSGNYLEVRIAIPTEMIKTSGRVYSTDKVESILKEETKWADQANSRRQANKIAKIVLIIIVVCIAIFVDILLIIKIRKYIKLGKEEIEIKPTQKNQYFRDFPREEASPAEAKLLSTKNKFEIYTNELGNVFSANLLNLYYLGYIDIEENKKDKNNTRFIIKNAYIENNKIKNKDEKAVYDYLIKVSSDKEAITLKELQKYITKHPTSIEKLNSEISNGIKDKLYEKQYIDKEKEKEYKKYENTKILYIVILVIISFITIIIATENLIIAGVFTITIGLIIGCIIAISKFGNRISVYSQEALDEIEQWGGLKRFMNDLSQMDKKEIPEVVLWEKYLIYATAFGIANNVLKQLKLIYPNFEEQVGINTSTHISLILSSNISNSISNSLNSSISSAYSSGSGSGGGFSGGGRRRRRPVVVEAEDRPLKSNKKQLQY